MTLSGEGGVEETLLLVGLYFSENWGGGLSAPVQSANTILKFRIAD